MKGKLLLLILPLTILISAVLSIYSFLVSNWPSAVSLYFAIICIISVFTARQSVFIQSSMFWKIGDLNKEEREELIASIAKDFGVFFFIYGVAATLVYLGLYWLVNKI